MTTTTTPFSSWIESIGYHQGFLAVFVVGGDTALLYGPTEPEGMSGIHVIVPSWLPGLLKAGTGRRSVGLAYNRLLKGKGYAYQRVEGIEKVNELKRLMQRGVA